MKTFLICSIALLSAAAAAQTRISVDFVLIKGGAFMMGSPLQEAERGRDETPHRVTVSDFYMAKSEVTQKEWTALMGDNPSNSKGENLPVENISWFDAVRYCNARSVKDGLVPAYTINGETVTWNGSAGGYRLPTESEWEYACRAGTTTPFNTGNTISDSQANFNNHYGYNNNSSGRITGGYRGRSLEVNSFKANPWGLSDMHGNVGEWCWDLYGEYTDPQGAMDMTLRVYRGGGWNDFPKHIRSAYRAAFPPENSAFNLGFRLVRNGKSN
jgi:formylglycine-generating enzyme required for sulfatase activity